MPLKYSPRSGQILRCDFSQGFKKPEITKLRPVIVLACHPVMNPQSNGVVSVVCLSTREPNPEKGWHRKIDSRFMPNIPFFIGKDTWLKGDLVYSVSFERLNAYYEGRDEKGRRKYYTQVIGRDEMNEIRQCVRLGINL